jgi:hypothetical protein
LASHGGFGAFFRGLAATAAREAGWTFGFLGLAPLVKHALREDSKFFNRNDVAASLAASVLAGQAAALLTQPADTIKALLQADLARVGAHSIHSLSRVHMPIMHVQLDVYRCSPQATAAAARAAEALGTPHLLPAGAETAAAAVVASGPGLQGALRFNNTWAAVQHLYLLPQVCGSA